MTIRRAVHSDVAVIGAGAAGLSSAIEVASAGATVAIIDAAPVAGGTAATAGGGTCIAGSMLQARQGIDDSPDIALEDWISWGGPTTDVEWAERYLRDSAPLLFERLAGMGVSWIGLQHPEGNRVPRWHQPEGGGAAVMAKLEKHARELSGITWLLGYRALELLREGGRVTGVLCADDSAEIEVSARSTVVASGGFNNNYEMVHQQAIHAANAERILLGGGEGAQGQGHQLLADVGAQFTQLDAVWMFPYGTPDYRDPNSLRGLAIRGVESDVWINDDGLRFHNESMRSGATGTMALLQQPFGRCWSVIDARTASAMTIADPYYRHRAKPIRERVDEFLRTSPFVESAPTLGELAARMGVDAANFTESLNRVNAAFAAGAEHEPDFGKPLHGLEPTTEAPYYAIRFHPMARKNLGGVRTDTACRVLDLHGRPISGLHAAGEVAGMAGGRINGRAALEGTSFGPSLYSGLIAGRSAL